MTTSLHAFLSSRFRQAFGKPTVSHGNDHRWELRAHAGAPPINVLVDSSRDYPVVWVYDPQDRAETYSAAVSTQEEAEQLVREIQQRLSGLS